MRDAYGNLVAGSSSLKNRKASEETAASKRRKSTAAWNARYFQHLGVGTGLGGAAAIEKYKASHPGWEKQRDAWAQSKAKKAKAKPKAGAFQQSTKGRNIKDLAGMAAQR